jgi:hypothetical protein
MEMKNNAVWTILAVAAFGVAAAAVAVARKGKTPTPERVLDECLRAADELESRVRSAVSDLATA